MMSPEDVLLEAITAASQYGDSDDLRRKECEKLSKSIRRWVPFYAHPDYQEDAQDDQLGGD
jgi:hypothetical protein